MVIKNVSLDIVCGITANSRTPTDRRLHLQENQMWKIIADQRADEPEISCQNKCTAGKNTDH